MDSKVIFLLAGVAIFSLAGIAFAATLWLRKLRDVIALSLSEMAGHQVRSVQRVSEALDQLQKQQDLATKQIRALAQEGLRLQKEISHVVRKLDSIDEEPVRQRLKTLH